MVDPRRSCAPSGDRVRLTKMKGGLEYDGLGLRGLLHRLDLLFHWLESGGEYSCGQLGYVLGIADGGFNPLFNQPLL